MSQRETLRDRYLALRERPDEAAAAAFREELARIELPPLATLDGLALSPCPTGRYRQPRWVEVDALPAAARGAFAPNPELPKLALAFADPEALAFHSFENIIALDRLFEGCVGRDVQLITQRQPAPGVTRLQLAFSADLRALLESLDGLGLYASPPNGLARDGQRFIFHAAELATALGDALRPALEAELPAFSHVNPVFRCNRFEPGDRGFPPHVDNPYSDPARGHVSSHTLLLYLTGGRGDPALALPGAAIESLSPGSAVVFEQSLEHGGRPFADGPKVFLRSELIVRRERPPQDPQVASWFMQGCYLVGECPLAPELERLADERFERAARARWALIERELEPTPFVRKRFRGLAWVSNGHDHWFPPEADPVVCAALALLDVANASLGGQPFRSLLERETLSVASREALAAALAGGPASEQLFHALYKPGLLAEPDEPDPEMSWPRSPELYDEPFPEGWEAARHPQLTAALERAQGLVREALESAPILVLGEALYLDRERVHHAPGRVSFLSSERLRPIHFAGAAIYRSESFLGIEHAFETLQPLVPPILYARGPRALHLTLDLFRSGWTCHQRPAPTPRIIDDPDAQVDRSPWREAMGLPEDFLEEWYRPGQAF